MSKLASQTHKDRVHEFNSKLEALSEHHDIPKVCFLALLRLVLTNKQLGGTWIRLAHKQEYDSCFINHYFVSAFRAVILASMYCSVRFLDKSTRFSDLMTRKSYRASSVQLLSICCMNRQVLGQLLSSHPLLGLQRTVCWY